MHLYERVEQIIKSEGLSRKQLAHLLDVPQNTFNRYFCQEQQTKLAQHLWKIFSIFPEVSREWLFFGEGEPFGNDAPVSPATAKIPVEEVTALQAKVAELEAELREADRLNRQLVTRLLVDGTGDMNDQK